MYYESNNTLQHHGILGQKWGVRRYQNKDGSWTNTGKKHRAEYADSLDGYDKYQKYVTKKLGGENTRANAYAAQAIAKTISSNKASSIQKALYTANVVRIAQKDNKKERKDLVINDKDSKTTKIAKTDYNNMSDLEFRAKYGTSKDKYAKRASKGDPFKKSIAKTAVSTLIAANSPERQITYKSGNQTLTATVGGKRNTMMKVASDVAYSSYVTNSSVLKGKAYVGVSKIFNNEN